MVLGPVEVGDGSEYAVDDHTASGDSVAGPDGGVFGVGFVYVGENGGELSAVVGYLKDVELRLADEVGAVARGVEPDGRVFTLLLCGRLGRSEGVVELLLELGDGSVVV